jgi:protein-L-isoaspartate(D-aspartate) O-methyltransferase
MDYARAREMMVESQVRTNDVTDARVLRAMRTLPRERFIPAQKRALAYADAEVDVAPGRTLLRPRDLSKLVQALAPRAHERALEIAGATGYGAAVLAGCCKQVTLLEADPDLAFAAASALEAVGLANANVVTGPAPIGWPELAPYDVILLNGAAEVVPEAWFAQLAPGGRLGVIVRDGAAGAARIYTRSDTTVAYSTAFDAAPPVIKGLERPPAFAF